MSHKIAESPWESVGTDIFTINNEYYICIVDYHSTFHVVKKMEGLSADNVMKTCKTIFSKYRLASKIVSDADTNFISEKSEHFCRWPDICHTLSSSYNYESKRQKTYLSFVKRTIRKWYKTNANIYMSLLQIRSTPINPRLPSLTILLFNRLSRGILLRFRSPPTGCDNNDSSHSALINRQPQQAKMLILTKIFFFLPVGCTIVGQ